MRRVDSRTAAAIAAAFFFVGQGCAQSPRDVVDSAFEAAVHGDTEGFLDHLTLSSAAMARVLMAMEDRSQRTERFFRPRPGLAPAHSTGQRVGPDRAVVTIDDGVRPAELILALEEGRWRIDLFQSDRPWSHPLSDLGLDPTGKPTVQ